MGGNLALVQQTIGTAYEIDTRDAILFFEETRDPEVLRKQTELARTYGISGFCFYYYWFGGKVLLDLPIRTMLESGRPDFPFCICWANENWTRRWDGREEDVLIAQNHSSEDDDNFIEHIEQVLRDGRALVHVPGTLEGLARIRFFARAHQIETEIEKRVRIVRIDRRRLPGESRGVFETIVSRRLLTEAAITEA